MELTKSCVSTDSVRCREDIAKSRLTILRSNDSKEKKKKKQEVADKLRDIFYASSRPKAMEFYNQFVLDYEKLFPSAVNSLKSNIESCLSFFSFPKDEWISLRTTNAIERVNKEFKRRTKPMEILAGEESTYRLLSFIALKMELTWRSAPLGRNNLPALDKFTQKS